MGTVNLQVDVRDATAEACEKAMQGLVILKGDIFQLGVNVEGGLL